MARIVEHLPVAELEARYRAAQDASPCRGTGGTIPGGPGRGRGSAPPGDLAAGAGADRPRSGRGAGLRAALGGAAGRPLQRLRPWGAGRPAAAEWPGGKPAHPRGAVRLGRAAEAAARGWRAVERPQGRGLDGAASWSGGGASAARLGGAEAARVVAPGPAAAAPPHGYARAAGGAEKKLDEAVARAAAEHPGRPVEVWAEDEHRLGLKPVRRRVWAPRRPAAGRARPPPLRVAAGGRLRPADQRRDGLVSRERPPQALLRSAARRLRPAGRRWTRTPHRPRARQRRLARPGGFGRPGGDQPRLPAALQPGAAAGRASLALGRRAHRQSALRHARRSRGRRRRTLPPARARHPQAAHRLPLVAQADQPELISRCRYKTG